jgi:hypothetical protein
MQISTILSQIDLGSIALPEFQRGYVWNRDQVRKLMYALYRRHPVGSLLVWVTKTESASARGDGALTPGSVKLLLDGQQRITSLYGIINGKPPKFFEGNSDSFTGLHFNLEDETFEFYLPLKMKGNPLWINVSKLMQVGVGDFIQDMLSQSSLQPNLSTYIKRLNAVEGIKSIDLHIEEVTGEDKTVDIVVDIFNQVNSGGTKLSTGDLALAKVCAGWPEARQEMKARLDTWSTAGFDFKLDWLLRNINAIVTGDAIFSALKDVDPLTFQHGLKQAEKSINYLLNVISGRLGLDHDRVLGGRYAFPVMSRYLVLRGGKLHNATESDKLLYWYVHTFLWGRFAGSTESVLNQDLRLLGDDVGSLDRLIEQLRRSRGNLLTRPEDFEVWSQGSRFYPLLYLLTRVLHARDWGSGLPLAANLLGKGNKLQVHHIFPKAVLYKHGYSQAEVNAVANFCFLTQDTNLNISAKLPAIYFVEVEKHYPGALASQWIPMDPDLWHVAQYRDFLAARRQLLANAANSFLESLLKGAIAEVKSTTEVLGRPLSVLPGSVASVEEEQILQQCNAWVIQQGLPAGQYMYELVNPLTGDPLAILDLAWPNGLQEGYSQPAALLLDDPPEIQEIVNRVGYRYFTDVAAFQSYVEEEILAVEPVLA